MKVSSAHQSLILANDGPTGGKPPASASQSSRSTSSGGTSATGLHRLTVVAELPDSIVLTVHADYAGDNSPGAYRHPVSQSDRVVSSQTPSDSHDSDADVDGLSGSTASSGASASKQSGASGNAVATTGTNTTASTLASASSLVQLSSTSYSSLLRDSDDSRDAAGNPASRNGSVALYARTERTTGFTRSPSLLDVHA